MAKNLDYLTLTALDAYSALADCGSYVGAGQQLMISPTTVARRVDRLQAWLHRLLIDKDGASITLTDEGTKFLITTQKVLQLIAANDLAGSLSKTRVQADCTVTVEGVLIPGIGSGMIGQKMVASRAKPDPNYQQPPKALGVDIIF